MKVKFKCVNIHHHPHSNTTLVKFVPVDAPAGDLTLSFEDGETKFLDEQVVKNEAAGTFKVMVAANSVVDSFAPAGESVVFKVDSTYEFSIG